jgi:hypothetical protein
MFHVMAELDPAIPIRWNAALHRIGITGTRPVMTLEGVIRRDVMFSLCS